MSNNSDKDKVYAKPQPMIVDFAFDEKVANVFPDMIRRSVPGYETVITMTGLLAEQYAQANSVVYDLGSSLGAATLSMHRRIHQPGCRIVAVDNSTAMTERCREILQQEESAIPVDIICADIQDIKIEQASVVVLNFTLQFIEPEQRLALLQKIYQGLLPGGVLVLSEKFSFSNQQQQQFQTDLQLAFKKANGYSDLEISQKRTALEKVLIPDSMADHQQRLQQAGFAHSHVWFQCFNFGSLVAFK